MPVVLAFSQSSRAFLLAPVDECARAGPAPAGSCCAGRSDRSGPCRRSACAHHAGSPVASAGRAGDRLGRGGTTSCAESAARAGCWWRSLVDPPVDALGRAVLVPDLEVGVDLALHEAQLGQLLAAAGVGAVVIAELVRPVVPLQQRHVGSALGFAQGDRRRLDRRDDAGEDGVQAAAHAATSSTTGVDAFVALAMAARAATHGPGECWNLIDIACSFLTVYA